MSIHSFLLIWAVIQVILPGSQTKPEPTPSEDACIDLSPNCANFKFQCNIDSFVQGRCKKTCNRCDKSATCNELNCPLNEKCIEGNGLKAATCVCDYGYTLEGDVCIGYVASEINFNDFNGTAESTSFGWGGVPRLAFGTAEGTPSGYAGKRFWHSGSSGTMPQAVWYNFHHPVMVVRYSFKSRVDTHNAEFVADGPSKYEVFGSRSPDCSDNSSWVVLHRDSSGTPFSKERDFKTGQVDIPEFYTCYGFNVIDVPGRPRGNEFAGNKYTAIRLIKLFGSVESHSID